MAKSGIVAITFAIMKICSVLEAWDLKVRAALDAAVTAGHITSGERDTAIAFLNTVATACIIFRKASGY